MEAAQEFHKLNHLSLKRQIRKGLLRHEWARTGSGFILFLPSVPVIWCFVGIAAPPDSVEWMAWFLFSFMVYAWIHGTQAFVRESMSGSDEFALSLPPSRRERFLVKFALGAAMIAALQAIALLTLYTKWPSDLMGMFGPPINSARDPGPLQLYGHPGRVLYLLLFAFAVYVSGFARSAVIRTAEDQRMWALEGVGLTALGVGLYKIDALISGHFVGWLAVPATLVYITARFRMGLHAYQNREAVLDVAPPDAAARRMNHIKKAIAVFLLVVGVAVQIIMIDHIRARRQTREQLAPPPTHEVDGSPAQP